MAVQAERLPTTSTEKAPNISFRIQPQPDLRVASLLVPQVPDHKRREIFELMTESDELWVLKFYSPLPVHESRLNLNSREYNKLRSELSERQEINQSEAQSFLHDRSIDFISSNWDIVSAILQGNSKGNYRPSIYREVRLNGFTEGWKPDIVAIGDDGAVYIIEIGGNIEASDQRHRRYLKNKQVRKAGKKFDELFEFRFPVKLYTVLYKIGDTGAIELNFKETPREIFMTTISRDAPTVSTPQ